MIQLTCTYVCSTHNKNNIMLMRQQLHKLAKDCKCVPYGWKLLRDKIFEVFVDFCLPLKIKIFVIKC